MLKLLLKSPSSAIPTKLLRVLGCLKTQTQPKNSFSSSPSPPPPPPPSSLSSSASSFSSISSTCKTKEDTLCYRLLPIRDPSSSMVPILDQWVTQGRPLQQNELRGIIKLFRKYKRYKHALEICKWMLDMKGLDLTPGDVAIQLDLMSKVHGLEHAEMYFDSIPESLRVFQVYGALLNCYSNSKSLEKAENIMQKMRTMGYREVLSYNTMLGLYSQTERYDKMDSLMQEMEEKGIDFDKHSFNIRLNAYVAASDMEGMEKLLADMELNCQIVMDHNTYMIAAKGYLKAGNTVKALDVLRKKCEQLIKRRKVNYAYRRLLTLYASVGKIRDVYRIWHLLRKFGKFQNTDYLAMIISLEKLDDLENAEKILEEWVRVANKTHIDIRVPNLMVTAYCKRSHLDKAELLIKQLIDNGFQPNADTWYQMARGYSEHNDKEKAVEMIKKAIYITKPGVNIDFIALASCLEYLKEKGEFDSAEELIRLLEERSSSSVNIIKERIAECTSRRKLASEELSHLGEAEKTLEEDILEDSMFSSTR